MQNKIQEILDICEDEQKNYKLFTALKWLLYMQQGKSPISTLRNMGIKQIVVYGVTDLGQLFLREAEKENYYVQAITDKRIVSGGYEINGVAAIRIEDLLLPQYVDSVVVVTAVNFWQEIKSELGKIGIFNVISLRELLEC